LKSFVSGRWREVSGSDARGLVAGTAFGRGAFTTLGIQSGQALFCDLHLTRLRADAGSLNLPWPGQRVIRQRLKEGCARIRQTDAVVRILVGRSTSEPTLSLLFEPPRATPVAASLLLAEVKPRNGAQIKSLGLAFWQSYRHQARSQSCFDTLAHQGGRVLESSVANVFFVKGSDTLTSLADGAILPGIARGQLLGREELGILERPLSVASLQSVDAIFLANSVRGVVPVERILHPRGALVWWGDAVRVQPHQQAWQHLVKTHLDRARPL
jgi:branched-subunit amino acid aminotransferase/4-amino-4-deoxychorismate lyase